MGASQYCDTAQHLTQLSFMFPLESRELLLLLLLLLLFLQMAAVAGNMAASLLLPRRQRHQRKRPQLPGSSYEYLLSRHQRQRGVAHLGTTERLRRAMAGVLAGEGGVSSR
jgi:hypothetical protein